MFVESIKPKRWKSTSLYYHMILILAVFNTAENLSVVLNLVFEILCFSPQSAVYMNTISD